MSPEEERANRAAWWFVGAFAVVTLGLLIAIAVIMPPTGLEALVLAYGIYFAAMFAAGWIWLYISKDRNN